MNPKEREMARRDRRDRAPEDRLVGIGYDLLGWAMRHRAVCVAVLAAAAAAAAGALAYRSRLNAYNEGAIAAFDAARSPEEFKAVADDYPGSTVEPLAIFCRGRALVDEKKYREAGEAFARLAAEYPGHYLAAPARNFSGMICEQLGDWEGAARNYRAAAEGYPRSFVAPRALLGLGSCYEEMKRPADSKTVYEKIVSSYGAGGAKKEAESRLARAATAPPPGTQ